MLPPEPRPVRPEATASAWPRVVAALPAGAHLVGGTVLTSRGAQHLDVFVDRRIDTGRVSSALERSGDLTVTTCTDDTLNGLLDATRVQFLDAATRQLLDTSTVVAGMPVAGVRDLMADKLEVARGRLELRDYFDLMAIEQAGTHRCEQGLAYYRQRYGLGPDDTSLAAIVRALGYLDDVADEPGLPVGRDVVEDYWRRRHPELVESLGSRSYTHGVGQDLPSTAPPRPSSPQPPSPSTRCGAWMSRARARCLRRPGHRGSHRSR